MVCDEANDVTVLGISVLILCMDPDSFFEAAEINGICSSVIYSEYLNLGRQPKDASWTKHSSVLHQQNLPTVS
jgi:hypothetical protein